jgi:glutamine amidotransferase
MITLIDYGVGNISALESVYRGLNIKTKIAKTASDLELAEKLILPGVGSFDHALKKLNQSGMREKLEELVLVDKVPVLGICVGMQMMATKSDEGNAEGLNWINAEVLKFDESTINNDTKIPHMGWNDVIVKKNNKIFLNLEKDSLFYFLHSYYFKCNDEKDTIATSEYGSFFTAAINNNNIYGIQFHPEKSHHYGEILLENFAKL